MFSARDDLRRAWTTTAARCASPDTTGPADGRLARRGAERLRDRRHAGDVVRVHRRGRRGHPLVGAGHLGGVRRGGVHRGIDGRSGRSDRVFEVTCHTGPGVTASGRPSSREIVSVDRRLFPFGTRLYIDQVGVRVAADTGPAMVGRRLDIWEPSAAACTAFGRKRLVVWRAP